MPVQFSAFDQPVDPAQIPILESRVRATLPRAYKELLIQYNSAVPEENVYRTDRVTTNIAYFFGVTADQGHDLVAQNEVMFANRLPRGVLAVAHAGGGNLICLRISDGSVYFWNHEQEATEDEEPGYGNMVKLAASFQEFLEQLQPYRREDFFPNASKVKSVKLKPGFQEKFGKYM